MEVAQQIRYFVAVDQQIGYFVLVDWLRLASNLASGIGSWLRLASALVVCVCVYFGEAGVWMSAAGCERGRLWVVGEWPCTWVGCRQWIVATTVLRVLLLMCYLCVFL